MISTIFNKRMWIIFTIQVTVVVAALLIAYALRFDLDVPKSQWRIFWLLLPALLTIKLTVFWKMGLFRGWWRYVSMSDLILIFKSNVFASLLIFTYAVLVYRFENISRTVLVLDFVFCFLFMGGVRFVTRAFRENYFPMSSSQGGKKQRTVIVGAGDAGQMIVREIRQNDNLMMDVVGFIDDDPYKRRQKFQGLPVLGKQEDLPAVCQKNKIDEVIIAVPSASGHQIRSIVERCQSVGVKFKTLPGVGDLIDGKVSVQHIRDVNLEDLLGREAIRLEVSRIESCLQGKRVLITGAGGSIGSEICRQVARFSPSKIILFENAETPLFAIESELSARFPGIPLCAIIGDVRYRSRVDAIFDEMMPEVVFHAAAYKHVPMMENNPAEAANNNVRGTKIVADAAHALGVERFVMISTDKAVNPTNIMGATKRAAELYVQMLAKKSSTRFVTVRFGNVLGSNGSVIPTFKEQIRKGGPVTVTHPDVTRFFMTIPEATQLVLQAGSMGQGGEIFLLDMGESVRIVKLAEELIRLSGLDPYHDIDIVFTGLRPGEKLYEELLLAGEGVLETSHEKIRVARAAECDHSQLEKNLDLLFQSVRILDLNGVKQKLQDIVPEYRSAGEAGDSKVLLHPALKSVSRDGSSAL